MPKTLEFTTITVIQKPSEVKFTCPHCKHENRIDFDDFMDGQHSDYYEDWDHIICGGCGRDSEVVCVDWD